MTFWEFEHCVAAWVTANGGAKTTEQATPAQMAYLDELMASVPDTFH